MTSSVAKPSELPPRARRIRIVQNQHGAQTGTTSACAENTNIVTFLSKFCGNYLRVRGEYWRNSNDDHGKGELPPRARRIFRDGQRDLENRGTTSACAENTK